MEKCGQLQPFCKAFPLQTCIYTKIFSDEIYTEMNALLLQKYAYVKLVHFFQLLNSVLLWYNWNVTNTTTCFASERKKDSIKSNINQHTTREKSE